MPTGADILDGKTGQVAEQIRVDVLDADANLVNVVHPLASSQGTIKFNTESAITRTWSGVEFDPAEAAVLTAGVHRLRPVYVLPATGDEYTLGVFLFLGGAFNEQAGYQWMKCAPMPDRAYQLDQKLDQPFGIAAGASLTAALASLAAGAGISSVAITPSGVTNGTTPLAWAAGSNKRLTVCGAITKLLGYLPVYFNNAGTLIARPVPVVADSAPDHVYEPGSNCRIIPSTTSTTNDVTKKPNRYIVRSTAAQSLQFAGIYNVPDAWPNSLSKVGYVIPEFYDVPGLTSNAHAYSVAQALALADADTPTVISFDAAPDPRHDGWDIVAFEGTRYLEQQWSLPLKAGGPHTHTIRASDATTTGGS